MHGTMCYGCKGSGKVFTKRGLAAKLFFEDSLSCLAEDIRVGDTIRCWSGVKKFYTVTETRTDTMPDGRLVVELHMAASIYRCMAGTKIRKGADGETKAAKLAAALEYQSNLTVQGKISRRVAKKA